MPKIFRPKILAKIDSNDVSNRATSKAGEMKNGSSRFCQSAKRRCAPTPTKHLHPEKLAVLEPKINPKNLKFFLKIQNKKLLEKIPRSSQKKFEFW